MLDEVLVDLAATADEVEGHLAGRSDLDFSRPTPSAGWTVAHQIAHLAWTDEIAHLAVTDPAAFLRGLAPLVEDPTAAIDRAAVDGLAPPAELLARWRRSRAAIGRALREAPRDRKIPWLGTTLSPTSMATARLMETWAHGVDIGDAFGRRPQPSPALRHVAFLGYRTLGHGFAAHGRPVPTEPVRVELDTTAGERWDFGPESADNVVKGPALDFCLLVTQRRHPADLALQATGPVATEWLRVAQVFAGPPGPKREPTTGRERTSA